MTETDSYNNPVSATFNGILDLFRKKVPIGELRDDERLDGKTCLVTGANSGLGRAVALQLVQRGARVIMACRSGIPEAGEALKSETGSDLIEMVKLDLSDLNAIKACCAELKEKQIKLDRVVLNAGLVPQKPQQTKQGFDMMFGVHFVGNMQFVLQLLKDGTIPNASYAGNAISGETARIVFVSSESHRSGTPIDFATFGEPVEYSAMGSIAQYGHSKLVMTAFAMELSDRLQSADGVDVSVHALCPGPINSNIAREAPALFKPILGAVMGVLFASPEKAAAPAMYLTVSSDIEAQTGIYLHLMAKKSPAPQACDPAVKARVWAEGEAFLAQ